MTRQQKNIMIFNLSVISKGYSNNCFDQIERMGLQLMIQDSSSNSQ